MCNSSPGPEGIQKRSRPITSIFLKTVTDVVDSCSNLRVALRGLAACTATPNVPMTGSAYENEYRTLSSCNQRTRTTNSSFWNQKFLIPQNPSQKHSNIKQI